MSSAIRFVTHNSCSRVGSVYLQCRVKPGASKQREGIVSISETTIEICVCAQAQKGEANKAVLNIISQALKCAKSDVEIVRGLLSKYKTVAIISTGMDGSDASLEKIRKQLLKYPSH